MAARTESQDAERQEAADRLRELLKPGDTVYSFLQHVRVSLYAWSNGEGLVCLDRYVQQLGLSPSHRASGRDGLGTPYGTPYGIDVGFELVYALTYALWPDGFECVEEGCPNNEHTYGGDYSPHWHKMPWHALWHEWI